MTSPYRDVPHEILVDLVEDLEIKLQEKTEELQRKKKISDLVRRIWRREHLLWLGITLICGGLISLVALSSNWDTSTPECRRYARANNINCLQWSVQERVGDHGCTCRIRTTNEDSPELHFEIPESIRIQYRTGLSGSNVNYFPPPEEE